MAEHDDYYGPERAETAYEGLREAYAAAGMTDSEKEDFINANLDTRLGHLSTLVTLTANRAYNDIADEVAAALEDGVTPIEIKEAIYHSGAYCGYTRAAGALDAADAALEALGQAVPYESRITSTEETRYEDGLAVQRTLFGPQIGTITDDMSENMKLQTRYLSGICFGDFYNRTGLSLYTREFLTFCTIAGNGNCAGQLTGHINGNLSVGHSKDMLRAAVLLNEEYNGDKKTQLALDMIDATENEVTADPAPERPQPTETIDTGYTSDSEELLGIMEHFAADDTDGYITSNLDEPTRELLTEAAIATVDGTEPPTSDDEATQLLITLSVMTAQGGREADIPETVAESLAAGNTADQMLAIPLLTAPYNGFPRTLNMTSSLTSAIAEAQTAQTETPEGDGQTAEARTTVTMRIGDPVMTVNDVERNIDENGTTPVISEDRTLLPVRAFVEGIGGTASWDAGTQTATILDADTIDNVFALGGLNPAAPVFTGVSYMNWLSEYNDAMQIPAFGQVTFEPCTRTDWHSHDGGQILLVTEGVGVFEMEGEPARLMQAGDVILIPPGARHMHSAIDDSWFAHIAISVNPGVGTTNRFEPVTDEEYNSVSAGENVAVVETTHGGVRGYINNGTYTYHGIPYAQAAERFVPAHEVNWDGTRDAYTYGAISPQTGSAELPPTDENCQNLNIWTQGINDSGKRPIMVWLHGGGFSTGSSIESPAYDGTNLSEKGDVVVVSINHRLNLLGHLDLSAYDEKYRYSANVGMTDIVAALEWIQDNIERFGGDPYNVTVFGESGGGAKVLALMTSPYAKGLFHKGIVESGATENMGAKFTELDVSRRLTQNILADLGVSEDNIEALQTIPYDELAAASDRALVSTAEELGIYEAFVNGYSLLWEPVVDGDFLPTGSVLDNGFAEAGYDIPLLIGSNLNEWTVYNGQMADPNAPMSAEELSARMAEQYGDNADAVAAAFAEAYPNEPATEALYVDSTLIRLPILKITAHKADQGGAPVYSYIFSWGTSYHTAEIPFVFDNTDRVTVSGDADEARALSEIMSQAWINFARTGDPNGEGVSEWEPYTREGGATMIFDNESYLTHDHDRELQSILAPDYVY